MPLHERQRQILSDLVSEPSFYSRVEPVGNECAIQERIEELLKKTGCLLERQQVDDDRWNLIAQKGSPIDEAELVILLYCHTDTIMGENDWHNTYDLQCSDGKMGGVGVYDMKAGVMAIIDLLRETEFPKGMTVVGAFCVGEEQESDGAITLLQWPKLSRVDLVLSPEIATIADRQENDHPKDVVIGRRGTVKTWCNVGVESAHAYKTQLPDANDAFIELRNNLWSRFRPRRHEFLGDECLKLRWMSTLGGGEHAQTAARVRAKFAHYIVLPTTIKEMCDWQAACLNDIMTERRWVEQKISAQITRGRLTSYPPYLIDRDVPLARGVLEGVGDFYGGYNPVAGGSSADGCIIYPEFHMPWFDIGPKGGLEHSGNEYVSEESLVRLIDCYRQLLIEKLPDFQERQPSHQQTLFPSH